MQHQRICPVTGKPCDEPRVYQITEVKGDASSSVNCCRVCAAVHIDDLNRRAKANESPMLPSAMDFLNSMMDELGAIRIEQTDGGLVIPMKVGEHTVGQPERRCPGCRLTIQDIMSKGMVGCGKCFEFYQRELGDLFPGAHHDALQPLSTHMKKKLRPEEVDPDAIRELAIHQRQRLQERLDEAILREDYERAGLLRNQIDLLRKHHGLD